MFTLLLFVIVATLGISSLSPRMSLPHHRDRGHYGENLCMIPRLILGRCSFL